jgi:hypothetical protein
VTPIPGAAVKTPPVRVDESPTAKTFQEMIAAVKTQAALQGVVNKFMAAQAAYSQTEVNAVMLAIDEKQQELNDTK